MRKNEKADGVLHPSSDADVPLVSASFFLFDDDPDDEQETFDFSYFYGRTRSMCQGVVEADVEDIAQEAWISFSLKFLKGGINNPKAYSIRVIRNKFMDFLRKEKRFPFILTVSLSVNDENSEADFTMLYCKDMDNQASYPGRRIEEMEYLHELAVALFELPRRQRRAIACTLLDKLGDLLPLRHVFTYHHMDEAEMYWPINKEEKRVLQASLPEARRNLAGLMHIDLRQYRKKKRSLQLQAVD